MKKRIVVTVLVVSLVSVGVFAGSMKYNKEKGFPTEREQVNSSLYVENDGTFNKNVRQNERFTRNRLSENCSLEEQAKANQNRRNHNSKQSPKNLNRSTSSQRVDSSQGMRDGIRPYYQNNGVNSSN